MKLFPEVQINEYTREFPNLLYGQDLISSCWIRIAFLKAAPFSYECCGSNVAPNIAQQTRLTIHTRQIFCRILPIHMYGTNFQVRKFLPHVNLHYLLLQYLKVATNGDQFCRTRGPSNVDGGVLTVSWQQMMEGGKEESGMWDFNMPNPLFSCEIRCHRRGLAASHSPLPTENTSTLGWACMCIGEGGGVLAV